MFPHVLSESRISESRVSFCDFLDILMNNINSLNPAVSIIFGDFNGKYSNWYSFDISDNIEKELDIITSTAGYTQIIGDYKTANASSTQRVTENLNWQ